jgi:hypothetical protein
VGRRMPRKKGKKVFLKFFRVSKASGFFKKQGK